MSFSRTLPPLVAVVNLEVGLEQVAHGEVGGGLAVGDRAAFEHEPVVGVMGAGELVDQAGLAHPGLPNDRHDLAMAGAGALQGLAKASTSACRPTNRVSPTGRKRLQARPGGCGTVLWSSENGHTIKLPGRFFRTHWD